MMSRFIVLIGAVCIMFGAQSDAFAQSCPAPLGYFQRITTSASGVQGNAASPNYKDYKAWPSMGGPDLVYEYMWSKDSTSIIFSSIATNLVAGDTNGASDVFVKNVSSGAISRVSLGPNGAQLGYHSHWGAISPDGKKVAYVTAIEATDNPRTHIYTRDLGTGVVTKVTQNTTPAYSFAPSFSSDGASLLWSGYTYDAYHSVYIQNLTTGVRQRFCGCADTVGGWLSSNSSKLVFSQFDYNPYPNAVMQLYIRTLSTGAQSVISSNSQNVPALGGKDIYGDYGTTTSYNASFAASDTLVAFDSSSPNLVANDTNGFRDVFMKNLTTNETKRLSVSASNAGGNGHSTYGQLSSNGSYLLFESKATNLNIDSASLTNAGKWNVFLKNIATGSVYLVTKASNGDSLGAKFSPDGKTISFLSNASNLVSNDTNNSWDIFTAPLTSVLSAQ